MTEALVTPAEVAKSALGWSSLITATRRLSMIHGALTVPRHDVNGGLLFDVDATGPDENDRERVLGIPRTAEPTGRRSSRTSSASRTSRS